MADPITLSVTGLDVLGAAVQKASAQAHAAIGPALVEEAERIMGLSKEQYVPVDFGTLRASGTVHPPELDRDGVQVRLTYGGPSAPYAHSVHENPRAGHTDGITPSGHQRAHWASVGEWKYLETPFLAASARLRDRVAASIASALRWGA